MIGPTSLSFAANRTLLLGSLNHALPDSLRPPFAALLPAFEAAERRSAEATVGALLELGCVELCCVGPEAEQLHDAIDAILEDKERLGIVTTADGDCVEACEYFVFAAAGRPPMLIALVGSHSEVVAALKLAVCDQ